MVALYGYYIGKSTDEEIRFKATSGGVGTAITKYLLSKKEFDTVLSFKFDYVNSEYVPCFIHSFDDYNICGSVYQDIDIPRFIEDHIDEIGKGIIASATPCQIPVIRHILKKYSKKAFIISFNCSGQTTKEGTWKYYNLLGLNRNDVVNMQYRGNGWPSGIQIKLKDGQTIFKDNWTKPWTTLHSSRLYAPLRCFFCKLDTSYISDISLADPWLREYKENDKRGHTMFLIHTELGKSVIDEMFKKGLLSYKSSSLDDYVLSQKPNVEKKQRVERTKRSLKLLIKIRNNAFYYKLATYNLFTLSVHNRIMKCISYFLEEK